MHPVTPTVPATPVIRRTDRRDLPAPVRWFLVSLSTAFAIAVVTEHITVDAFATTLLIPLLALCIVASWMTVYTLATATVRAIRRR